MEKNIQAYDLSNIGHLIDFVRDNYNELKYGWKSNVSKPYDNGHWHQMILPDSKAIGYDHSELHYIERHPVIEELWNHMKTILGKDTKLVRAYVNGYTYGTDAYFHIDDYWLQQEFGDDITSDTVLIYLNDEEWNADWGGETSILDDDNNFLASVFPARNRCIIFDSTLRHSARNLTRACPVLRKVLVFKTAGEEYNRPQVKWLKDRTYTIPHSGVTLFEHLYETAKIVEKMPNTSRTVVNAALYHSVYGTEFFKDNPKISKEEVIEQIGEDAEELVNIFCKVKGRFEYILLNKGKHSKQMHFDLLCMEYANTLEQYQRRKSDRAAEQLEKLQNIIDKMNSELTSPMQAKFHTIPAS